LLRHPRRLKEGMTSRLSGTLEQPFAAVEWSRYVPDLWDKNGHPNQ